jgi:hypothetical protein
MGSILWWHSASHPTQQENTPCFPATQIETINTFLAIYKESKQPFQASTQNSEEKKKTLIYSLLDLE